MLFQSKSQYITLYFFMMTKDFFVVYAYKLLQVVIIILNDIIILQIVNLIFVREFLKIETMCKNTKTKKKQLYKVFNT